MNKLAAAPRMAFDVTTLLHQVDSLGKLYAEKQFNASSSRVRKELSAAVSKLSLALETPEEVVDRVVYMPMDTVMIRIAIELNIFKLLIKNDGPMSTRELAQATGADYTLLGRILRCLAASNILEEVDVEAYLPTKVATAFATEKGRANLKSFFDCMEYGWHKLPEFLAETKYQNPEDSKYCALNKGLNTDEQVFTWIFRHPEYLADFNIFLGGQREARANWLDYYPLDGEFEHCSTEKDAVFFLDIGGGLGQEIQAIRNRYPKVPGRMILQDLSANTDQITSSEDMEAMTHDFFMPQPVKGARVYYFRSIMHDWPDHKNREILSHTCEAMTKGYSKILINEFVVPSRGASAFMTHIDMNMMCTLASMERTEKQWRSLLESVGLKVVKIWTTEEDSECIIEAMLA